MAGFFTELRRRNVIRVGIAYGIVSWVLTEIASVVFDAFAFPPWAIQLFISFVMLGFPLVLLFAWAYEMTPEGLKREKDIDRSQSITPQTGRKLDRAIIGLLVVALSYFVYQQFFGAGTGRPELAGDADRSIAVLPFTNRSADEENAAFFADGIHDDLLTILSRISDLKVISRTSVERYRGSDKSMPEIAAELGVATILEGSVQRAGDRVRINAQLIDAQSDKHVWADIYDEELTAANIFDIQQRIATRIANALHTTLSDEVVEDIAIRPTASLEAYDTYLRGRELLRHETAEALDEAESLFRRALELDPEFALAWTGLARSQALRPWYQYPGPAAIRTMDTYIDKAFLIEPDLAEAHVTRGLVRRRQDMFEGAELAFRRALTLNPNDAEALHWFGNLLLEMRRPDEALANLNRALELDPLSPRLNLDLAAALELAGDYDAALDQYHKTLEIDPRYVYAYSEIGWMHWDLLGRMDEAVRWYRRGLEIDPNNNALLFQLTQLYLDLGDDVAAEKIARHAEASGEEDALSPMLEVYQFRGEDDKTADAAQRVLARQPGDIRSITALGSTLLNDGKSREALEMLEDRIPHLLSEPPPEIDSRIDRISLLIATTLIANGQRDRAQYYLDGSSAVLATGLRHAPRGFDLSYDIAKVENLALRGQTDEALDELREAIDSGWRFGWGYLADRQALASLRDHPRFISMLRELEVDVAAQRARLADHRD